MKNVQTEIAGKVAFLSGASGFLGQEIAYGLASAGVTLYLNGRDEEKLKNLSSSLNHKGYKSFVVPFDLSDEEEVKHFFRNFKENRLDIIVHSAYSGLSGTIETSSSNNFMDSYQIAVIAIQNFIKAALPLLRKAKEEFGDASVVNISSMYGMVSPNLNIYKNADESNPPFYGAAKAALIQWTKYAACEFAKEGIRFNSISPGPFPSLEAQKENKDLMIEIRKKVPMSRLGNPSEIIGPVLFLANPSSSYVTGINLPVDGGWTAW